MDFYGISYRKKVIIYLQHNNRNNCLDHQN